MKKNVLFLLLIFFAIPAIAQENIFLIEVIQAVFLSVGVIYIAFLDGQKKKERNSFKSTLKLGQCKKSEIDLSEYGMKI